MEENKKNPDEQVNVSTTVEQVDVNIDELFGMPGAESVMLPENSEKPEKKSLFTKRIEKKNKKVHKKSCWTIFIYFSSAHKWSIC